MNINELKIGYLVDSAGQDSYQIKNGKAYILGTDEPFYSTNGISNEYFTACFGIPFAVGDGYFVNWRKNGLPDIDFDVIYVVIEKRPRQYNLQAIRDKYPNAYLIATTKERNPNDFLPDSRIKLFNDCDSVVIPYGYVSDELKSKINKKIYSYYVPYDVELIYDRYYKEDRKEVLFVGSNRWAPNRGLDETIMFTKYLSDKHHIPYSLETTIREGITYIDDWLNLKSKYTFCINIDGPEQGVGQVAIQCAILGVIHIGSVTESAQYLFPTTCGMNLQELEKRFDEIVNDPEERLRIIQYAWDKVWERYSYEAFNNNLQTILNEENTNSTHNI